MWLICCLQVSIGDPELDGFKVQLIDTCGLEDPEAGDTVNYGVSNLPPRTSILQCICCMKLITAQLLDRGTAPAA